MAKALYLKWTISLVNQYLKLTWSNHRFITWFTRYNVFWHQLLYCLALRSQKNQCNDKNNTIGNYYECQLPKSSHSCGWVEYDLSPIYSIHEPVRWVMSAITYVDTYLTCKVYAVLKVRTNDQFKIQSNFRKKLWYFDTPYSQDY